MRPLLLSLLLALFSWTALGAGADGGANLETRRDWNPFVETNFPFFSSVLDARKAGAPFPANNLTPRGLILNLGHGQWACFDLDLLRVSAIWAGTGVTPVSMAQGSYFIGGIKAPEGQAKLPAPAGTVLLASGIFPGWQRGDHPRFTDPRDPGPDPREVGRGPLDYATARFRAVRMDRGGGVTLEYELGGTKVTDALRATASGAVERTVHLEPLSEPLWLLLGWMNPARAPRISVRGDHLERRDQPNGCIALRVTSSPEPVQFTITLGDPAGASAAQKLATPRWPQIVITRGTLAPNAAAYVLDTVPLPLNNPWKRNVRIGDIAFFGDGRAAVVSFDGDVWIVSGLSGDLDHITWKRFASGLHEPLSICIRAGEIFVFDRNGIWNLKDTDGDGEADRHELFSNAFAQTAETREFASGMRAAPDGSFVIAKGGQEGTTIGKDNGSILRVAPDGNSATVLGWGLRQPFLGVNPRTGLVTASDQQGHYIPATPLHIIRDHHFYGFIPLILPKEKYPAPITEPLTWIPHAINASAASQVWLTGARMGPLNDALIHLGYYRPEIFLVRLNDRAPRPQAAVVSITRDIPFPPLAGTVNPVDGQLYLAGFQIWGSVAPEVSGIARLRYTGGENTLPREVAPFDKGVLLRFDVPLEPGFATNLRNFSAERWNYKRTANYGSPHYKLDGTTGQEMLRPSAAYLSTDRKSVFVAIPGMTFSMQMRLGWQLAAAAGKTFSENAYFTPYERPPFDPVREGFGAIEVNLTPSAEITETAAPVTAAEGKRLAELMGCAACHSTDGSTIGKVGPSWKGLFGSERRFADHTRAKATEEYIRQSIRQPAAKVVSGFEKSDTGMPSYDGVLTATQIESLIAYIKTLH